MIELLDLADQVRDLSQEVPDY